MKETFASVPYESSDDEDWIDTAIPRKNGARHVPSVSPSDSIPVLGDETNKKRGREKSRSTSKRLLQNVSMGDTYNSPDKLHEDSLSGSRSKRSRPSTYRRLGEAVVKVI